MQAQASKDQSMLGKSIADAAATIQGSELFIWSSLADASKWSQGQYRKAWHFESKARVVDYIKEAHPHLAKQMSILQMGLFVENWKWGPISVPWFKEADVTNILRIPGNGHQAVSFVNPSDTGKFIDALAQLPKGTVLLAYGDRLTWDQDVSMWTECTNVKARLQKTSIHQHFTLDGDAGYAEEMAKTYAYMVDYGYHGRDPGVLMPADV
ncbi:hypothetical protein LTR78_001265 [Recurvomyces mirabilis]|uniref:NmrA-like domain-containing protein n=2 Tax=Recurvomyces mirabilis TaxID=574656 RepID=A0AAE1C5I4_9PEZI|nr:hypothetical protein LTR78_001265 [Recurvomyces mirabilis]